MEVVGGGGVWNTCKFLASSAPSCEVKGVDLKCRPIVVDTHYLGCQRAPPDMETVDSFMQFSYDVVYLLVVEALEQGFCQPSFEYFTIKNDIVTGLPFQVLCFIFIWW